MFAIGSGAWEGGGEGGGRRGGAAHTTQACTSSTIRGSFATARVVTVPSETFTDSVCCLHPNSHWRSVTRLRVGWWTFRIVALPQAVAANLKSADSESPEGSTTRTGTMALLVVLSD